MGFGSYLKDLFRPLGLYQLDEGIGSMELDTQGEELDRLYDWMVELERESIPATARDWGLGLYEEILPYHPAAATLDQRRSAVMALLRIDGTSFTLQGIRDTIAGSGITATVAENSKRKTVEIAFPGVRGEPAQFEALRRRIEQILPCHLDIVYALVYLTWQELEGFGFTWSGIENRGFTWKELEIYGGEV